MGVSLAPLELPKQKIELLESITRHPDQIVMSILDDSAKTLANLLRSL